MVFGATKLNENVLNSIPDNWRKQAYIQGFDFEYITFKSAVNVFERTEIS